MYASSIAISSSSFACADMAEAEEAELAPPWMIEISDQPGDLARGSGLLGERERGCSCTGAGESSERTGGRGPGPRSRRDWWAGCTFGCHSEGVGARRGRGPARGGALVHLSVQFSADSGLLAWVLASFEDTETLFAVITKI